MKYKNFIPILFTQHCIFSTVYLEFFHFIEWKFFPPEKCEKEINSKNINQRDLMHASSIFQVLFKIKKRVISIFFSALLQQSA